MHAHQATVSLGIIVAPCGPCVVSVLHPDDLSLGMQKEATDA